MVDGTSADARLERLLHVLPAASREGGARFRELADELGTSAERILEDLRLATDRVYYHPGGWPDDMLIQYDAERVRVVHAEGLDRPVRLNARELLCLALALRGGLAAARLPEDDGRQSLLRRAESRLARSPEDGDGGAPGPPPIEAPHRRPDPEAIRETLLRATEARTPCALMYAKAGADDADLRVIHPYRVVWADGTWYTVGHCTVSDGVRVFRVDRILEAAPTDDTFQVPDSFDPAPFLEDGQVYHAEEEREVRVRYSPRIARWVRERAEYREAPLEEDGQGGVVLTHRVADPGWVVSHALQYGPDAEILDPPEVRAMVRKVVEGMAG